MSDIPSIAIIFQTTQAELQVISANIRENRSIAAVETKYPQLIEAFVEICKSREGTANEGLRIAGEIKPNWSVSGDTPNIKFGLLDNRVMNGDCDTFLREIEFQYMLLGMLIWSVLTPMMDEGELQQVMELVGKSHEVPRGVEDWGLKVFAIMCAQLSIRLLDGIARNKTQEDELKQVVKDLFNVGPLGERNNVKYIRWYEEESASTLSEKRTVLFEGIMTLKEGGADLACALVVRYLCRRVLRIGRENNKMLSNYVDDELYLHTQQTITLRANEDATSYDLVYPLLPEASSKETGEIICNFMANTIQGGGQSLPYVISKLRLLSAANHAECYAKMPLSERGLAFLAGRESYIKKEYVKQEKITDLVPKFRISIDADGSYTSTYSGSNLGLDDYKKALRRLKRTELTSRGIEDSEVLGASLVGIGAIIPLIVVILMYSTCNLDTLKIDPAALLSTGLVIAGILSTTAKVSYVRDWPWYDVVRGKVVYTTVSAFSNYHKLNPELVTCILIRREKGLNEYVTTRNSCYLSRWPRTGKLDLVPLSTQICPLGGLLVLKEGKAISCYHMIIYGGRTRACVLKIVGSYSINDHRLHVQESVVSTSNLLIVGVGINGMIG
jgi:hypothetical protein